MQMTDPFEMQFLYRKGMITNHLNKSKRRSERAFSNSGVTKTTSIKFDRRSTVASHKV